LVPELTGGLLMKEAIAPSRQRPKLGVFVITSSVYLLLRTLFLLLVNKNYISLNCRFRFVYRNSDYHVILYKFLEINSCS
jgi:hypothetical protein